MIDVVLFLQCALCFWAGDHRVLNFWPKEVGLISQIKEKIAHETVFLSVRWLLAPLYMVLLLGLVVALVAMVGDLYHLWMGVMLSTIGRDDVILSFLHLIEYVMIANLVWTIGMGSYSIYVHPVSQAKQGIDFQWLERIDSYGLKTKMGMALIGVSSAHLLEAFFNVENLSTDDFLKLVSIHALLVVSTIALSRIGTDHGCLSNSRK